MSERKIPVEVFSRCVGYFRPVQDWNNGKKEEFSMRRPFDANAYCRREFSTAEADA